MPIKLTTLLNSITTSVPNQTNASVISEFYYFMKDNGTSESYQKNNLKTVISFARYLGNSTKFYDIQRKEQIISFLDTKVKSNDVVGLLLGILGRIKFFMRWLYNHYKKKSQGLEAHSSMSDWITPSFVQIKKKLTKRISPYIENELWDKDEFLTIIKYEPYKRNKAALSLLWDFDARNHEVTLLKIKHIRLKEKYGEGEIPYEAKTGAGPILLTCSFPYVRDWLNEHPFKNEPNARLICNV